MICTIVCRYILFLVNMRVYVNFSYLEVSGFIFEIDFVLFEVGGNAEKSLISRIDNLA